MSAIYTVLIGYLLLDLLLDNKARHEFKRQSDDMLHKSVGVCIEVSDSFTPPLFPKLVPSSSIAQILSQEAYTFQLGGLAVAATCLSHPLGHSFETLAVLSSCRRNHGF